MKKLLFIIVCFVGLSVSAETINQKYSYEDFTHKNFLDIDSSEFNDTVIYRSCLYQETSQFENDLSLTPPDSRKQIFPDGIKGVILRECNADNVLPQSGLTIEPNSSNRRIRSYKNKGGTKDGRDWVLDEDNKPDKLVNPGEEPQID